jgi:hypothetical protein
VSDQVRDLRLHDIRAELQCDPAVPSCKASRLLGTPQGKDVHASVRVENVRLEHRTTPQ